MTPDRDSVLLFAEAIFPSLKPPGLLGGLRKNSCVRGGHSQYGMETCCFNAMIYGI
jgi:hypothetical protein